MAERHFNDLTPTEAERLALLAEECGEVIQAIGKVLRHGYRSTNPDDRSHVSNRHSLELEIGHVTAAAEMLCNDDQFDLFHIQESHDAKLASVRQWLHHAGPTGG
jgi:NTP pyrophosphatase (non-canonical NTP hydrolase)